MNYKLLTKKYFIDPIIINNRKIYPYVKLDVDVIASGFLSLDYEVIAFKIIEKSEIFFKNVSMSNNEFNNFKKKFIENK